MRPLSVLVSLLAVALVAWVGLGRGGATVTQDATPIVGGAQTQDATPAATAGHPLVGAWRIVDVDDEGRVPALVVFTSDGVYQHTNYDFSSGYGAWEATGPTSATMTFVQQFPDEEGNYGGSVTFRAAIEADPDGQRFTADYTIEAVGGEGNPAGEYGPGGVVGTRIEVESPGTPVGPLSVLFGGEEGGTPEAATPAP